MLASSTTGGQAFPEGLPDGAPLPRSAERKPHRPTRFEAAMALPQQAAADDSSLLGKRPQPEATASPAAESAAVEKRRRLEQTIALSSAPGQTAAAGPAGAAPPSMNQGGKPPSAASAIQWEARDTTAATTAPSGEPPWLSVEFRGAPPDRTHRFLPSGCIMRQGCCCQAPRSETCSYNT